MFDRKIADENAKTNISCSYRQKWDFEAIYMVEGDQPRDAIVRATKLGKVCRVPLRKLIESFPEEEPEKLLRKVVLDYIQSNKGSSRPARKARIDQSRAPETIGTDRDSENRNTGDSIETE